MPIQMDRRSQIAAEAAAGEDQLVGIHVGAGRDYWGASILPSDKGCWPMRGKSIEQILAVCPKGKTCQIAGVLKNLTRGLYCWTEVNSVIANDEG